VASEVEPLRTVLVHRPGAELERLTPQNMQAFLFDDVSWLERARAEHDAFTAAMRDRGVRVLDVRDLLAQTLAVPQARREVLDATMADAAPGPLLGPPLRDWLDGMRAPELAEVLVAGVTPQELPFAAARGLAARLGGAYGFVLAPLPNHLFTRDTSAWVRGAVAVAEMAHPARRRETVHVGAILRHHPLFATARDARAPLGSLRLEGGDLLVPRPDRVLIGLGPRTSASAVDALAGVLFGDGIREVLAFELPSSRATIHLDTLMTFVDHDAVVAHPDFDELVTPWRLVPGRHGPRAHPLGSALAELSRTLETPVRAVAASATPAHAAREQWSDGHNVLALAPGVVLAYDRNERTNEALARAGIEVIAFPGSELGRGRGGPRCMSCPIERRPS
jgi:arginine deiminase